jgi:hypothetical protein
MDCDFQSRRGNDALPKMLRDNVWHWVKPRDLIDTNWADPDGDVWTTIQFQCSTSHSLQGQQELNPMCSVIVRDGDFLNDKKTSDHRPIELRLAIPLVK